MRRSDTLSGVRWGVGYLEVEVEVKEAVKAEVKWVKDERKKEEGRYGWFWNVTWIQYLKPG